MILCSLCSVGLAGQGSFCHHDYQVNPAVNYAGPFTASANGSGVTLRIVAHIVTDGTATGAVTEQQVVEAVARANATFDANATGINFYLDPCIQYIDDATLFSSNIFTSAWWTTNASILPSTTTAIDLILLPTTNGSNGGIADGIAIGSRLALAGRFPLSSLPTVDSHLLEHELGHVFGLLHTFGPLLSQRTWLGNMCCAGGVPGPGSGNPPYGEPAGAAARNVVVGTTPGGADILVCHTTGDHICGTPADPTRDYSTCIQGYNSNDCPPGPGPHPSNPDCDNSDWNGDTYVPMDDNVMDYVPDDCLSLFHTEQSEVMLNTIATLPHLTACIYTPPQPLTITGIVTITSEVEYDHDVIVAAGGILNVQPGGVLRFAQGMGITVEKNGAIRVLGGVLTKRNCVGDEEWKGVRLMRESRAVMNAGSLVEYAERGINYYDEYPTPAVVPTMLISNTSFTACGAGINIDIPTGPVILPSARVDLTDNIFTACSTGISDFFGERLRCFDSQFIDCDQGIIVTHADANIDNCSFIGGTYGVVQLNFGGNVTPSRFVDNFFADQSLEGLSINNFGDDATYRVADNLFLNQNRGLVIAGGSDSYLVEINDFFDCSVGVNYRGSGGGLNWNWQNTYSGMTLVGAVAEGMNAQLDFRRDCFSDIGWGDVALAGTIGMEQGNTDFSNSNEFSKIQGVASFLEVFLGFPSFNYYTKIGSTVADNRVPFPGSGFTTVDQSEDWRTDDCGSGNVVPPNIDKCPCGFTVQQTVVLIQQVRKEIDELVADTTINPYYRDYLVAKYKQCLLKLLTRCHRGFAPYDEKGLSSDGNDFTADADTIDVDLLHRMAIAYLLRRGDMTTVMTYLNQHTGKFGDETALFESLITDKVNYVLTGSLTTSDLDGIENAALGTSIHNGMAYSLYYDATGLLLERTWDIPSQYRSSIDGGGPTTAADSWLYPNPLQGGTLYFDQELSGQLLAYDLAGRAVLSQVLSQAQSIPIGDLHTGVYVIKVVEPSGNVRTAKVVIQ